MTTSETNIPAGARLSMGFGLLLDLHYSDDWADPAHESTPVAWQKLKHKELTAAVFVFTRDTLAAFRQAATSIR